MLDADLRRRRFNVGDAVHDGMIAFCRAPRSFVLFALLLLALQLLLLPVQERLLLAPGSRQLPSDTLVGSLGVIASLCVSLWGTQGMVRGAWEALGGGRPRLILLLRWDGPGFRRLLGAWLAVSALLLLPLLLLLALTLLAMLLTPLLQGNPGQGLAALAGLLLGVLALAAVGCFGLLLAYLSVNQQFLAQVALLEGRTGLATLQRGRQLVDPQWVLLLLLLLVKGTLMALGGLLAVVTLGIGWMVAWPLVSCITTAAYRQLRQQQNPASAGPAAAQTAH